MKAEQFKTFKKKQINYRIPQSNGTKTELVGLSEWLISNHGRVILKHYREDNSLISEREVRQFWKGRVGSPKMLGIPTGEYVHRLVAQNFMENPNQLRFVEHIDGDRENNHVDNLQWTAKANRPTIQQGRKQRSDIGIKRK
jgi:hypothetical protein